MGCRFAVIDISTYQVMLICMVESCLSKNRGYFRKSVALLLQIFDRIAEKPLCAKILKSFCGPFRILNFGEGYIRK